MAAGDDGAIKYSSHTGTGTRKPQARPQGSKRVAWYCRNRGYEIKKQENSGERQRTEKEKEREKNMEEQSGLSLRAEKSLRAGQICTSDFEVIFHATRHRTEHCDLIYCIYDRLLELGHGEITANVSPNVTDLPPFVLYIAGSYVN